MRTCRYGSFCISASLTRAEEVIHERGPLWPAVRASLFLPGIFPPVCAAGDLLVDGGALNNLPAGVMRDRVGGGDDEERVSLGYVGGFSVSVPRFYCAIKGHDLEERIWSAFPPLRQYGGGLKAKIIKSALADIPEFAPQDVLDLFHRLIVG